MKMCASDSTNRGCFEAASILVARRGFFVFKPLEFEEIKKAPGGVVPGLKGCDGNT